MIRNPFRFVLLALLLAPVAAKAQSTGSAELQVGVEIPEVLVLGFVEQLRPVSFGTVAPGATATVQANDGERAGLWTLPVFTNVPEAAFTVSAELLNATSVNGESVSVTATTGQYRVGDGPWVDFDPRQPFRIVTGAGDHVVQIRVGGTVRAPSGARPALLAANGRIATLFSRGDD